MREARLDWPAAVPLWMFSVCVRVSKWGSGAAASEATSTQTEDKQSAGKKKPAGLQDNGLEQELD